MKKETLIPVIIIGSLILLGLGFIFGYSFEKKAIEKLKAESPLVDLSKSKVINSLTIIASGEVKEISGRNLTLNAEGDDLTILIREDASINGLVASEEKVTDIPQPLARKEIKFEEIKVGDKVNITCQLKTDGSLEGTETIVLP